MFTEWDTPKTSVCVYPTLKYENRQSRHWPGICRFSISSVVLDFLSENRNKGRASVQGSASTVLLSMHHEPATMTATRVPQWVTLTSEEVSSPLASLTGSLKGGISRAKCPPACVTVLGTHPSCARSALRDATDVPSLRRCHCVPSTDSPWGKKPGTQLQLAGNRLQREWCAGAAGAALGPWRLHGPVRRSRPVAGGRGPQHLGCSRAAFGTGTEAHETSPGFKEVHLSILLQSNSSKPFSASLK